MTVGNAVIFVFLYHAIDTFKCFKCMVHEWHNVFFFSEKNKFTYLNIGINIEQGPDGITQNVLFFLKQAWEWVMIKKQEKNLSWSATC